MYYVFMENTQIIKHQIIVLPTRVLYEKRYVIKKKKNNKDLYDHPDNSQFWA